MIEVATPVSSKVGFPEQDLRTAIEQWWDEETSKQLDDPFAAPGTLFEVLVDVDSLTAVNVLVAIESILGFEPPESLIRSGGYTDRNDMLGHLLPALRTLS